jgi:hypothetical protein
MGREEIAMIAEIDTPRAKTAFTAEARRRGDTGESKTGHKSQPAGSRTQAGVSMG